MDSRKIKKHRRDALRLAQLLSGDEIVGLPDPVAADIETFLADRKADPADLKQTIIAGISIDGILTAMSSVYLRK